MVKNDGTDIVMKVDGSVRQTERRRCLAACSGDGHGDVFLTAWRELTAVVCKSCVRPVLCLDKMDALFSSRSAAIALWAACTQYGADAFLRYLQNDSDTMYCGRQQLSANGQSGALNTS